MLKNFQRVRRPRVWLTVLGFTALAVPVVVYFSFIHRYAMNVIYFDQWQDIYLIAHRSHIWDQRNENRVLFPDLLVLVLGATTHFNVVIEEYLNGLMLVVTTTMFIWAHRRRSPTTPWLYYVPVALVMFSLVQAGSTLWGVNMPWYLTVTSMAVSLFFLDRRELTGLVLTLAIAAAVVGSYSSFEGLLIWPAGLVLFWHRRRPRGFVLIWIASALATTAIYFNDFNFSQTYSSQSGALSHSLQTVKLFFFLLGDVVGGRSYDAVGNPIPGAVHISTGLVVAIGVVIFSVALWVLVVYGIRRDDTGPSPFGVAVLCFALLIVAAIAYGRSSPGFVLSGGASRYATLTLLVPAGILLAVLRRPPPLRRFVVKTGVPVSQRVDGDRAASTVDVGTSTPVSIRRSGEAVARAVVGITICLLVVLGTWTGWAFGRYYLRQERTMADVTANLDKACDSIVSDTLFDSGAKWVRKWAPIAEARRLSIFDTGLIAQYRHEGLRSSLSSIRVTVASPKPDAVVSGAIFVGASTLPSVCGVASVRFLVSGGGIRHKLVASGESTSVGWLAGWVTTDVPNGKYQFYSVATGTTGTAGSSSPVSVTVEN